MNEINRGSGTIYTETVVFSAPEQYVNDAPYQLAIVDLDDGGRLTARILPESGRVQIGDRGGLRGRAKRRRLLRQTVSVRARRLPPWPACTPAPERPLRVVAAEAVKGGRGQEAFYSTCYEAMAEQVIAWYAM